MFSYASHLGEYIVLGADPVGVRFFVSLHYLLKQLMDFDQLWIDTLLGGEKEFINNFRSPGHFEMPQIWFLCVTF